MTAKERVIKLCADRGIALSKLEKDLGFGNGYIKNLRRGVIQEERLEKIAVYFGVGKEYIRVGKEDDFDESDVMEIREMLRTRPEAKVLFNAQKGAPASAILEAAALIERYKEESQNK